MKPFRSIIFLIATIGYLGVYNGKLCIYPSEKNIPAQVLPYSVYIFPEKDQAMLEQGIPYSDTMELDRIIADYMS